MSTRPGLFRENERPYSRRLSRAAYPLPHEQEDFLPAALLKLDLLFERDPFIVKLLKGQEQVLRDQERMNPRSSGSYRLPRLKGPVDLATVAQGNPELAADDLKPQPRPQGPAYELGRVRRPSASETALAELLAGPQGGRS